MHAHAYKAVDKRVLSAQACARSLALPCRAHSDRVDQVRRRAVSEPGQGHDGVSAPCTAEPLAPCRNICRGTLCVTTNMYNIQLATRQLQLATDRRPRGAPYTEARFAASSAVED
jgi:hypothetical protein